MLKLYFNGATFWNNHPISIDKGADVIVQNPCSQSKVLISPWARLWCESLNRIVMAVTPGLLRWWIQADGGKCKLREMMTRSTEIFMLMRQRLPGTAWNWKHDSIVRAYQAWGRDFVWLLRQSRRYTTPKATVSMNNAIWLNSHQLIV